MNRIPQILMNWKTNPHASGAVYLAVLCELGKLWFPQFADKFDGTAKILTFYGILAATTSGGPTPPATPEKNEGSTMKTATTLTMLILCGFIFSGCAFVKINDPQTGKPIVNAAVPAWPWQDSARTIAGISVTSRTNYTRATMTGLDDSQTTTSNAVNLVQSVVGAAVGAAINSAK